MQDEKLCEVRHLGDSGQRACGGAFKSGIAQLRDVVQGSCNVCCAEICPGRRPCWHCYATGQLQARQTRQTLQIRGAGGAQLQITCRTCVLVIMGVQTGNTQMLITTLHNIFEAGRLRASATAMGHC